MTMHRMICVMLNLAAAAAAAEAEGLLWHCTCEGNYDKLTRLLALAGATSWLERASEIWGLS